MQGMRLAEVKSHMKGLQCILQTPFNDDGSVDVEGMRSNIRWMMERFAARGFKDYFLNPLGGSSEFYVLTKDELKAVMKMCGEEAKGKVVLVTGGTGRITTRETIEMCQYAQSVGADGAFVILPYFMPPTEEGMYQHFKVLAENVDKDFGILIYNTLFSGSWIKPHLMARIAKIPNVICIKECTKLFADWIAMVRAVDPRDAVLLCGSGETAYLFQAAYGAAGYDAKCYDPDHDVDLYQAAVARDFDRMREIIDSGIPLARFGAKVRANHGPDCAIPMRIIGGGMGGAMFRAIMDIIGLKGGPGRLPLVDLNEGEKAELRGILKDLNIHK